MRKTKLVKKTVEVEETVDILCNMCGKSCSKELYKGHNEFYGLTEAEVFGGYYSPMFFDMSSYRFSLCEKCLDNIFQKFKIPVEYKSEETFGEYISIKDLSKVAKRYQKSMDLLEKRLKEKTDV